ncbi:MAG: XRE family transcriptional regulator [Terriglobia bacterium]|nr:XRE family transcriptional regulator [Terriglobia bacterium]
MGSFNREMLILARESRGYSQSELAGEIGINQATLSKIENGLREPTDEQIRRFAAFLGFRKEFFFLPERIKRFGSGCTYLRARKRTPEMRLRQLLGIINVRRIQLTGLLAGVELTPENEFPRFDIDEHGPPENIARNVRAIWMLPPGPIQNLTRAIEDAGGLILRCNFHTKDVDAISQFLPGGTPLFLVNDAIPADRLRWTIAHELGHLTMHYIPNSNMEKEADQFAAEFLMPADEIRPDLTEVSLAKLATLKPYWKVSMNALLKRAGDLDLITPRKRQFLWTQMGKSGYRTNEPISLPPEEPSLLDEMIATYSKDLGYNIAELSSIVHEAEDKVRDVYLPKRFKLRAV